MGNADLRQLAAIEGVPFDTLAGETVAIDAHNWLYRYLTVTVRYTNDDVYTTPDGTEVANLVAILQGLPRLLEHGVTPVFVFDGAPSELKEAEISERRASKEQREEELEAARERGDALEVARLDSQTQRLTDTIIETSRELLSRLDIPVVDAPAEGEAQAAYMSTEGDVDAVGTEDYDALLFGAPVTYRDLSSSGDIERMDLAATLSRHDLEYEQLVDVAILCGTDFNEGLHGVGPKTAVDLVHDHDTLDGVLAAREDDIPGADRVRSLFLDPTVTDDYEFDTAVAPDVESAREFVIDAWGVSASAVESYLDRIADATKQTGLDQFT